MCTLCGCIKVKSLQHYIFMFSTAIFKKAKSTYIYLSLMPAPEMETNISSVNNHTVHRQQKILLFAIMVEKNNSNECWCMKQIQRKYVQNICLLMQKST